MKRIITFLVIGLLFSCSVDDGLNQPEDQIDEKFVVTELNGCMADVLNLSAGGSLAVLNQENKIYLTVTANDGFELSKAYFQIEESTSDFPVENNGNLNPRKLEHSKSFTKGIGSHTFEVEWQEGVDAIIAMYVVFKQKAGPTLSGWTGDLPGSNGKWSYFEYLMCTPQAEPCGDLTAGKDNSKTITYGEAAAIGDWEGVKNHYLSLLEPGVPRDGSFDPSIWDIIYAFNGAENPLGDYTTVYTITEGECSASVELTITVIPDASDPVCDLDAGSDNNKTITYSEAAAIGDWEGVKNHYLSLLEPGVPREGSFDPSIWDIIYAFNGAENPLGDYTTVYTITNGECTDSVELTITVVAD